MEKKKMWDPYADLKRFQLPNGLTVYLGTWDRPWLQVGIMVHTGARQDPAGKEGIDHFLEHLLIENIPSWTFEAARQYFEQRGGAAKFGATYYDGTKYQFKVPLEENNLEFALNLFGHMLVDCKIDQFIERERQVIIREFTQKFPMRWMADRVLKRRQLLFPGTRLARFLSPLGTPESILSISADEIQVFYDHHYTPANITMVAVGGLKPEEFKVVLEKSPFGLEKPGRRTSLATAITQFDPPAEKKLIHRVSEYSLQLSDQSGIESYAALPGTIKPKALGRATDVLEDIFFKEIREQRGWTYGFGTSWCNFTEAYEFCIQGAFPWESLGLVEDVVDECLHKAEKQTNLIQHHIQASVTGFKINDVNAGQLINTSLDDLRLFHRIKSLEEERGEAAAVTVEEVQAVMALFSRDRRWTQIVHP